MFSAFIVFVILPKGTMMFFKKIPIILTLTVVAVVYYIMVCQNLFVCDDFRYAFIQGTDKPIQTIADAVSSQCHAYMFENGRFLVHTFVQCFAGIWGMEWLRIYNTLFFVVFLWCACILVNKGTGKPMDVSLVLFVCLIMLFAIPVFGYSFLGNIACSINYLWTASLSLAFLCILNQHKEYKNNSRITSVCLCLCAIIIGAMQESFSIGLSVGVFFWMFINRKHVTYIQRSLIISYCIGSAIVILAPSNFLREDSWNSGSTSYIIRFICGLCSVLLYCHTMVVMCMCLIICAFVSPTRIKIFCKENICLLIAVGISTIFVAGVAFTGPHQLVSIELFSAIILLRLLITYKWFDKFLHNRYTVLLLSVILIGICLPIYYYRSNVKRAYEQMINTAKHSTDGCMIGGDYDHYSFGQRNFFVKYYTSTEFNQDVPLTSLSMYLSCGKNKSFINTRLPKSKKEIVAMCTDEINTTNSKVYHKGNDCFYVVKSTEENVTLLIEEKLNWMSNLRAMLLSHPIETQTKMIDATSLYHFNDGHNYYYIIYNSDAYPISKISVIENGGHHNE